MTREEAIEELERMLSHWDDLENGKRSFRWYSKDAVEVAISALRHVSRERVERMRGEWIAVGAITCKCSRCQHSELSTRANEYLFCPACGAPMTDEAVDIVMERLEELSNGKG